MRGPQAARRVGDTDVSNESAAGWRTLGDDFKYTEFNKGAVTLSAADHYQAGHGPIPALQVSRELPFVRREAAVRTRAAGHW